MRATRKCDGFTLLEATIALALFLILSTGVLFIWQYAAGRSMDIVARQNAFENARASMDALVMNLQMANTIVLETDAEHVLQQLTMTQRNPQGQPHNYIFYFDRHALPGEAKHHRLEFGLNNEFASNIALVHITYDSANGQMHITVRTDCLPPAIPVVLEGSVDVRFKTVVHIYP